MISIRLTRIQSIYVAIVLCAAGCTSVSTSGQPDGPRSIHWEKYSDDLFARAKMDNKFVLLDLEAVWCHWCHVQDEITYADPKVIELVNARYIAVKVDQDSRPDLSNRYEDYGWPATIVLNADGSDIVKRSGYIPPRPMAAMLAAIIRDPTPGPSVGAEMKVEFGNQSALSPEVRKELIARLDRAYDAKQGGWGVVHKFVDWDAVEYSLIQARAGDKEAERRVRQTLDGALKLIDPVWGGVYQYSTDGDWNHPHFEKLIQFQAEVMRAYTLGYAHFHDPKYLAAAQAIRAYIRDFLTSPNGAFYVSQDADLVPGEHSAGYFALDNAGRRKLGVPRVDTHTYSRETGWAIQGILAYYAHAQDPADLEAAINAANWVVSARSFEGSKPGVGDASHRLSSGGFRHGDKDVAGPYLGDTLAMGRAFLALYEATADRAWLRRAQAAADFINAHFRPSQTGSSGEAGFITAAAAPSDPLRPRPQIDENVAAVRFFNLLSYYTGRKQDRASADEAMRFLAAPKIAESRNLWLAGILLADLELSAEPLHMTIVGKRSDPQARALFMEAMKAPATYRRLEWWDPSEGDLPHADVQYPTLAKAAAFVCKGTICSSPVSTVTALDAKVGLPPSLPH